MNSAKGGRRRAEILSPERRREIASQAATARWQGGRSPSKAERPHDETRLPRWAQERIAELRREIEREQERHAQTRAVMAFTNDPEREWCTVLNQERRPGPLTAPLRLHTLRDEGSYCICSLGAGDVLFVGRAKKEKKP